MMQRFRNSWAIFKASAEVLKSDRELLWFPFLSAIAGLIVLISFLAPAIALIGTAEADVAQEDLPAAFYLVLFAMYVVLYFVTFFFNTALVGAAMIRLDGGDPGVRDGLRVARERAGVIFGYALIASTVGILLRAVEEKVGVVGRIVIGLIGATWTVASFLVVPVLVSRDVGPVDALRESVALLKRSWGENLIGHAGLGAVFVLVYVAVTACFAGLFLLMGSLESGPGFAMLAVVAVATVAMIAVLQSALTGVYSAVLYRHATGEPVPTAFDDAVIQDAFRARKQ